MNISGSDVSKEAANMILLGESKTAVESFVADQRTRRQLRLDCQ